MVAIDGERIDRVGIQIDECGGRIVVCRRKKELTFKPSTEAIDLF